MTISTSRWAVRSSVLLLALFSACTSSTPESGSFDIRDLTFSSRTEFEPNVGRFEGFFAAPYALDTDEEGNLYVLDPKEQPVVVLDPDLKALRTIGRKGNGPGEFDFARISANMGGIAVRAGLLAAFDSRLNVHVFRTDGTFLTRFRVRDPIEDLDPDGIILSSMSSAALYVGRLQSAR